MRSKTKILDQDKLFQSRQARARAGFHQSGPAPYGYRREYKLPESVGRLVIVRREARVIFSMFTQYIALESLDDLVDSLRGAEIRTRRDCWWNKAGVAWILKNVTYTGQVRYGNILVPGKHEAIVDRSTFNAVQKLLMVNRRNGKTTC